MTTQDSTFIHLVETSGIGHGTIRMAFSNEAAANEYAAGLEEYMGARVRRIPLDPDYREDWRTIIDLDRDGTVLRSDRRILTGDSITQAFFTGEAVIRPLTRERQSRVTYRNWRMRLESEEADRDGAIIVAQEVRQRAITAQIWPEENAARDGAAGQTLQEILESVLAEREDSP